MRVASLERPQAGAAVPRGVEGARGARVPLHLSGHGAEAETAEDRAGEAEAEGAVEAVVRQWSCEIGPHGVVKEIRRRRPSRWAGHARSTRRPESASTSRIGTANCGVVPEAPSTVRCVAGGGLTRRRRSRPTRIEVYSLRLGTRLDTTSCWLLSCCRRAASAVLQRRRFRVLLGLSFGAQLVGGRGLAG